MAAGQVAYRYANAWLSAAREKKAIEAISADCDALLSMVRNSPEFSAFLTSPLVKKNEQTKAVAAIAKQAKLHELTASMLAVLADNRRLPALEAVLEAAKAKLEAASGTSKAKVTSATPLDAAKVADIKAQLKSKLGHDVSVETHVDPALIGGMVVVVGSKMIDDSVKTKLDRLARRLTGNSAA
ncbi:MAG: ATP synthase F1 subunit delta [Alphaproteobacteria bacterium]|nr:ATP synthase F1 subunit delta [Alphaproteobacteria bacterium]